MQRKKTRQFKGIYYDKDKKEIRVNVKIFPRLVATGLAITLVASAGGKIVDNIETKIENHQSYEEVVVDEDLELIENILKSHPDMLKDSSIVNYKVKFGDTLGGIAIAFGTTVNDLVELNNMNNSKDTIYAGENLKVTESKALSNLDAEINMLESYFYDYVFESPFAKIARGEKEVDYEEQRLLFHSLLYGTPVGETEIDKTSIYGQYLNLYLNFHDDHGEKKTDEDKQEYIYKLNSLANKLAASLSNDTTNVIVGYDKYKTYCMNGTTKDKQTEKTIYG